MQVARCRRYGEQAALLVIDLDCFKQVNDTYGHKIGDELLKAVATELQHRLRGTDMVARLGGDEFAVLLPGTTAEAARKVAATLREAIAACGVDADGTRISVTAAIGDRRDRSRHPRRRSGADGRRPRDVRRQGSRQLPRALLAGLALG